MMMLNVGIVLEIQLKIGDAGCIKIFKCKSRLLPTFFNASSPDPLIAASGFAHAVMAATRVGISI